MDKNDSIPSDFCFWKAPVKTYTGAFQNFFNKIKGNENT